MQLTQVRNNFTHKRCFKQSFEHQDFSLNSNIRKIKNGSHKSLVIGFSMVPKRMVVQPEETPLEETIRQERLVKRKKKGERRGEMPHREQKSQKRYEKNSLLSCLTLQVKAY